jgi:hypothetical protein
MIYTVGEKNSQTDFIKRIAKLENSQTYLAQSIQDVLLNQESNSASNNDQIKKENFENDFSAEYYNRDLYRALDEGMFTSFSHSVIAP